MPQIFKLPTFTRCCYCVTDLKSAVAIIAVLGVVECLFILLLADLFVDSKLSYLTYYCRITCPAVSWALIRHSYVIRVSCYVTAATTRPDVVDINLNNILSFGFGAHAGLGPSCLGPSKKNSTKKFIKFKAKKDPETSDIVQATKILGWIVFVLDIIFVSCSLFLLYNLFLGPSLGRAITFFICSAIVSVLFSFVYSILYVVACVSIGGAFPVFELLFGIVDVLVWVYFLAVVNSFKKANLQDPASGTLYMRYLHARDFFNKGLND